MWDARTHEENTPFQLEGMLSSSVPDVLSTLKKRALDIVIGSRYVQRGKTDVWAADRKLLNRLAR
jgi:hypothetical protein